MYKPQEPVIATSGIDSSGLLGKSVIITGAARGLGRAYAEAFAKAGAFVTIGDIDGEAARALATSLGHSTAVGQECDVRKWSDQLSLFEAAISSAPTKGIDIVVANAGLGGANDPMMEDQDSEELPREPDLNVIDVNVRGVFYTTRLATHYFRRFRRRDASFQGCLILKGSMAGYIDWPKSRQYPASKAAIRDLMKCMRHSSLKDGTRVNVVAPAFVDTGIIPAAFKPKLIAAGLEFAEIEDAVKAILRISCDHTIHGRSFGVIPRSKAPEGYIDLAADDLTPASPLYTFEQMALNMKV